MIILSYGCAGTNFQKVLTRKVQTRSGIVVTMILADDNFSGALHGKQQFQIFIDPPLGDNLKDFHSVTLIFLRKPKIGGDWQPLRGFEVIFLGKQGTVTYILVHGVLKAKVRQNVIEFQGEVAADIVGKWKMEVTLVEKGTGKKERVTSDNFIVR
jgi:hypothetical protein